MKLLNKEIICYFDGYNIKDNYDTCVSSYQDDKTFSQNKFEILSEEDEEIEAIAYLRKVRDKNLFLFCNDIRIVLNLITKQQKELETYKKIAEFLAKNSVVRAKCERCVEDLDENGCIRCMLNWAKSEVLKNE